ncbi:hypothetical protein L208DRAFT_1393926 [Tricholoma matsutake]|nr:hypothetical protein L208DRAFT_1393926 [Tricholoma matsutake 945]
MLEPWEIILLLTIFSVFFTLVITGLFKYLPQQLVFMQRRAAYYLWGKEVDYSDF